MPDSKGASLTIPGGSLRGMGLGRRYAGPLGNHQPVLGVLESILCHPFYQLSDVADLPPHSTRETVEHLSQ